MSETLELRFGPLWPAFEEQLAEQGLRCPGVALFEKDRAAINHLRFRGGMTDGEADRACKRVLEAIARSALPAPASCPGGSNE